MNIPGGRSSFVSSLLAIFFHFALYETDTIWLTIRRVSTDSTLSVSVDPVSSPRLHACTNGSSVMHLIPSQLSPYETVTL